MIQALLRKLGPGGFCSGGGGSDGKCPDGESPGVTASAVASTA